MRKRLKTIPKSSVATTALFACALSLVIILIVSVHPRFTYSHYVLDGQESQPFTMPLRFNSESTDFTADISFTLDPIHISTFTLSVDDCVNRIVVNDQDLSYEELPFCSVDRPIILYLTDYLHVGDNSMQIFLHNNGGPGGFSFSASPLDPILLALYACIAILIIIAVTWIVLQIRKKEPGTSLIAVICLGIFLRALYMLITPYDVRGYDVDGHLEYMRFLVDNFSLPGEGQGWQWYQPPLYYMIGAPLLYFKDALANIILPTTALQIFALLLAVGSFAISIWIAFRLFRKHHSSVVLMSALLATLPGVVFFASRVNNDVLYHFFGVLSLGFLFAWWHKGPQKLWYLSVASAALSMLSKMNALLLLPILFTSLLCKKGMSLKQKITQGSLGVLTVAFLTEWLFALRLLANKQAGLVGNAGNLHSGLKLENTLYHLTTFNPARIIDIPFNNPWNDEAGRQFFWEYLFRSSLFGEFTFPESLSKITLALSLLAILLLAIMFMGMFLSIFKRFYEDLPVLLSFFIFAGGHFLFRIAYPFSSSQDFRYSVLLIIPIAYYIVFGIEQAPKKLRPILQAIALLFCSVSVIFFTALIFV